jgi:hypothetical protein
MGKLIISTHITVDGVIGPNPREWGILEGEGERFKYDQLLARSHRRHWIRRAHEQHSQVRRVPDAPRAAHLERLTDQGRPQRGRNPPQATASGQSDLVWLRRAGVRARQAGPRRRGPLLGQPGGLGQRRPCVRWPPGPAAVARNNRVRLGRRPPVLPPHIGQHGGTLRRSMTSCGTGGPPARRSGTRRRTVPNGNP